MVYSIRIGYFKFLLSKRQTPLELLHLLDNRFLLSQGKHSILLLVVHEGEFILDAFNTEERLHLVTQLFTLLGKLLNDILVLLVGLVDNLRTVNEDLLLVILLPFQLPRCFDVSNVLVPNLLAGELIHVALHLSSDFLDLVVDLVDLGIELVLAGLLKSIGLRGQIGDHGFEGDVEWGVVALPIATVLHPPALLVAGLSAALAPPAIAAVLAPPAIAAVLAPPAIAAVLASYFWLKREWMVYLSASPSCHRYGCHGPP